jgi:hypothetical protein
MRALQPVIVSVLRLGDIEIRTGATLLSAMDRGIHLGVHWFVLVLV